MQKTLCNRHCSSEQLKLVCASLPGPRNPVVSQGELSCMEAMTGSGRQRCSRPLTNGAVRVRCGRVEGLLRRTVAEGSTLEGWL